MDNISALTCIGHIYLACGMPSKSMKYWKKLSQLGSSYGSWKYGEYLYGGSDGAKPDSESAHQFLQRAFKQVMKVLTFFF